MWLSDIFSKKTEPRGQLRIRNVSAPFILNEKNREEYERQGFTIIKAAVSDQQIESLLTTLEKVKQMPGYFESDKLHSTSSFGKDAHALSTTTVNALAAAVFNGRIDTSTHRVDFGGSIIIKYKDCWVQPHQDCPIIDELKSVTAYAWIPTVSITKNNGTFHAIAGSHKWAAWQRTGQHHNWSMKNHSEFLWQQMRPIFVNKGDVLLFDSALIHASALNKSEAPRIACNICIVERSAPHVHYLKFKDTPKGKIEKYFVDDAFWEAGNYWERPTNYTRSVEPHDFPENITEAFLKEQIDNYRE